jgi:hypothetical protein
LNGWRWPHPRIVDTNPYKNGLAVYWGAQP